MRRNLARGLDSILAHELAYLAKWADAKEIADNPDAVVATADELERGLDSFVRLRAWTLNLAGGVTCTLFKSPNTRTRGRGSAPGKTRHPIHVEFSAGEPVAAFFLRAREIVEAEGMRLAPCHEPGCRKLLVRRKRGKFCSEHSGSAEYSRRWRHEQESEDIRKRRRERYLVQKAREANRPVSALIEARKKKNKLGDASR